MTVLQSPSQSGPIKRPFTGGRVHHDGQDPRLPATLVDLHIHVGG